MYARTSQALCDVFFINGVEMYLSVEQETEQLNWLQKHALEALIALILAIGSFQGIMMLDIAERLARVETNVNHIDDAVNNVAAGEKSLRDLVEQNCWALSRLNGDYKKC